MNGSAKLILSVLGLVVLLTLALDGYQSNAISEADMRAHAAKELAVRVDQRTEAQFSEILRRLEAIDEKID